MDLSINDDYLKIQSEENERLENIVAEYKKKDEQTILNKYINEIEKKISNNLLICNTIQTEIHKKLLIKNDLLKILEKQEIKSNSLKEELTQLELSILKIQKKKKDYESQLIIMEQNILTLEENILSLKENEKKLRKDLIKLNGSLEKKKKDYEIEKVTIDNEIQMIELEKFVLIKNPQFIFDNIKFNLVKILARNLKKYLKHIDKLHFMVKYKEIQARNWDSKNASEIKKQEEYYYAPQSQGSINGTGVLQPNIKYIASYYGYKYLPNDPKDKIYIIDFEYQYIHRKLCHVGGFGGINEIDYCDTCKFPNKYPKNPKLELKYISTYLRPTQPHELIEYWKEIDDTFNLKLCKWIEDKNNYSKILHEIIKNAELLKLSDELSYKEFYDLFYNSELFELDDYNSPKHNSLKFISLVAFVGSNGYDINFTECIEE